MPRLVHLNGPPGIGKSTVARRYVEDHRLAFCLDIDAFRRSIGGWDTHPEQSGQLARRMALAMVGEHLRGGHDVVVPQYVARPEFVRQLHGVAMTADAEFFEIVLLDEPAAARTRFEQRATDPAWATHHAEAARMIDASGGFTAMYQRLVDVVDDLPASRLVTTTTQDIEGAYRAVLAALGEPQAEDSPG